MACFMVFFFNDTATTEIYTLSLHDALPIFGAARPSRLPLAWGVNGFMSVVSAILAPMIALSWGFEAVFGGAALAYAVALMTARNNARIRDSSLSGSAD